MQCGCYLVGLCFGFDAAQFNTARKHLDLLTVIGLEMRKSGSSVAVLFNSVDPAPDARVILTGDCISGSLPVLLFPLFRRELCLPQLSKVLFETARDLDGIEGLEEPGFDKGYAGHGYSS
nr:hypothetical protein [Marinicella sp. W31]MDC2876104.1 hypothetical protein [Marinicella sp. W31]